MCASKQLIAPGKEETIKADYTVLENDIKTKKVMKSIGIRYVPIGMKLAKIRMTTASSFGNAQDLKL